LAGDISEKGYVVLKKGVRIV